MSNLIQKEKMINIYARGVSPPSPSYDPSMSLKKKAKLLNEFKNDTSFETISRVQNDYSPMLPSIVTKSPHPKVNYLKDNMSIAKQVIRSYRSFSRRHAYNLKFEVAKDEEVEPTESNTFDVKDTVSTNAASSPKARKNSRAKSDMSRTTSQCLPERIIHVKPIGGKEMLESIQETKESEQK